MSSHSEKLSKKMERKKNNNYINIQAIQEIYQSEGQHRVAIAYRSLSSRRLLLRLRAQIIKPLLLHSKPKL